MSLLSQFFEKRHEKNVNKEEGQQNQQIVSLFNNTAQTPKVKPSTKNKTIKKQEKKKKKAKEESQQSEAQVEQSEEEPVTKSKKQQKSSTNEAETLTKSQKRREKKRRQKLQRQGKKKQQTQGKGQKEEQKAQQNGQKNAQKQPQQPENLDSTIFVGNVPLNSTHKSMKKFFEKYGKIQKVWFRSIPVQESKIPKKGLHILKKYQQGADSMNAYVKFQKDQEAVNACQSNGEELEGKNIKVTLCKQFELDFETTIFIGNLPKKVKDQDLWEAFKPVGTVKSVRVIRNKDTMEGIGIGYVRFATKEEMLKAIKEMNGKPLGDRPMRIKKAVSKNRLEKKVNKIKQKKEQRLQKSRSNNDVEKTGKGTYKKQGDQNQFRQSHSNTNYPNKKGKPIRKPAYNNNNNNSAAAYHEKKRDDRPSYQNKRPWSSNKGENNSQKIDTTNQFVRTRVKFQGTKKILD